MPEPVAEFTFEDLWNEINKQSAVELRQEGDVDREDVMEQKNIGAFAAFALMKKVAQHPKVQLLKVLDPETRRHVWVLRRIA